MYTNRRNQMSAKILINGPAGTGKSTLVKSLRKPFVVSRDGKAFPFQIPHMTIKEYYDMATIIHGGEVQTEEGKVTIEGIFDKLEKYAEKNGEYPETVVIDSVSKLMQDAIDYANLNFTGFDVHSTINKEIAVLTTFIQEELVANGVNVILINHVMENDKKGYIPVGQGKFKDRGGFFAEVDESILVEESNGSISVTFRGSNNQARTLLDELPDKMYVENFINPSKSKKLKEGEEYFTLQWHIDLINDHATSIAEEYEY